MKIVFVHGSNSYGGVWRYQMAHFPDSDAITLPGHPEGEICKSVEEYTDWLKGYITEKGYRDVVLCGHSLGGAITLRYALSYPQYLKGIIIVNSGARFTALSAEFIKVREEAARGNVAPWHQQLEDLFRFTPEAHRREVVEKIKAIGPAVGLNDLLAAYRFNVLDRLQEITLPALIIHGDQDTICSLELANGMRAGLPNSKLVIIPRGTHQAFAEYPEVANKAIEDFLGALA